MGMRCDVSVASAEDFDRLSSGQDWCDEPRGGATATTNSVSLEKAWHGLHYLLTGESWEGQGPLAFLVTGGEELEEDDSMRWFSAEETAQIHQALSPVTDAQLWSRFDVDEMEQQEIYPEIWDEDEDDLKDEYLTYFHELKQVVAAAAQSDQGLLVSIG